MLLSILYRPVTAKLTLALFMAAQMLGLITFVNASETPPPSPVPTAPPNSLPAVRRALREFDRFLDHHPLLEEQLRIHPDVTARAEFLAKNPELQNFLRANPLVVEGLKIYPRYFLNRALLRQATAPLSFAELAPFKDLFLAEPTLEKELTLHPESIRDPAFLNSHPVLRSLLEQHPSLARVFLPPASPQ